MPTPTYTPLANITLGSSATSVTFSSISQEYKDLVLVANMAGTATGYGTLRLNNDTGNNYSIVYMMSDGTSVYTGSFASNSLVDYPVFFSSGARVLAITNLMDYSAAKITTTLTRAHTLGTDTHMTFASWNNTSAVTSIRWSFSNITAGSTFALYGVAA